MEIGSFNQKTCPLTSALWQDSLHGGEEPTPVPAALTNSSWQDPAPRRHATSLPKRPASVSGSMTSALPAKSPWIGRESFFFLTPWHELHTTEARLGEPELFPD